MTLPPRENGVGRFTFGTFQVTPGNRAAFEACCDVANLRMVLPQPVLLVGPDHAGKTHLLYAIANRVRQMDQRTGLVCVSAHRFPDEARKLVDDPSLLSKVSRAVLLLDQLDGFTGDGFEALIKAFASAGHGVVATSRKTPDAMENCSASLRDLLLRGSVYNVDPRSSNGKSSTNGSHSSNGGAKTTEAAAPELPRKTEPWGVVREELGQAYRELRWALEEVERLRKSNEEMSHRVSKPIAEALRTSPGIRQDSAALLARAEHALDELYSNRRRIEELRAAEAHDLQALRALAEREGMATDSESRDSLMRTNERLRRDLDQSRQECAEMRRALEAARTELAALRLQRDAGGAPMPEPLAELEDAARADVDDLDGADERLRMEPEQRRTLPRGGSSVYHVEQLDDDMDLIDDEPGMPRPDSDREGTV